MNVAVWLFYKVDIRYDFTREDCRDEQEYLERNRAADKAYYQERNQQYFDELARSAKAELNYISKFTPSLLLATTISEIPAIGELDGNGMDILDAAMIQRYLASMSQHLG